MSRSTCNVGHSQQRWNIVPGPSWQSWQKLSSQPRSLESRSWVQMPRDTNLTSALQSVNFARSRRSEAADCWAAATITECAQPALSHALPCEPSEAVGVSSFFFRAIHRSEDSAESHKPELSANSAPRGRRPCRSTWLWTRSAPVRPLVRTPFPPDRRYAHR